MVSLGVVQPRRLADRHRRATTRRRRSGTRRAAPRPSRSRGTPTSVNSAAFSPDGSRIVTASEDRTARVWDARSGAEVLTLKGHNAESSTRRRSAPTARASSPRATTDGEGLGRRERRRGPHAQGAHRPVVARRRSAPTARASSPRVTDGTAKVWDAQDRRRDPHAQRGAFTRLWDRVPAFGVAFSPDGSRVLTASETGRRRSGTRRTGAEVLTLKGHTGAVLSAAFSPDGSRIVTASDDRTAKVWDAQDRRRGPHAQGAHRMSSFRRRSAPTGRASSPRARTARRRSGTRRPAPRSSRSRGTPVASVRRRSARTARGSSPRVGPDGEGLGRREWRRAPHAQGAHRRGQVGIVQPRRVADHYGQSCGR